MTIQELDTYYNNLKKKLDSKNPDFELNKDRAHNTTIERFMFDNSLEECLCFGMIFMTI